MGAALGRAAGKAFLGRGLVKAGSRGASKFKMPRMSIGALRWAGTGSYRAIAEGAGESSASAVGRGVGSGAGHAMRVPRFRTTAARQSAQAGEEGIQMSTFSSGGRALAQPVGLVSRTGQSTMGRIGGALGRTTLPSRGLLGAGAAVVSAATIGVGASMRPDSEQDTRINKLPQSGGGVESEVPESTTGGGNKKPPDRPPPRKHPSPDLPSGSPNRPTVPPKAGRIPPNSTVPPRIPPQPPNVPPKAGRNPPSPTTQPPRNPGTNTGNTPPNPGDPNFLNDLTYDQIRGGLSRRPGAGVRGIRMAQRAELIRPTSYSAIRGSMLRYSGSGIMRDPTSQRLSERSIQSITNQQIRAALNAYMPGQRLMLGADVVHV